jgi:histone H3/H4
MHCSFLGFLSLYNIYMNRRVQVLDNINGITNHAIKGLSQKAGIKILSGLMYEEIRGTLLADLRNVIRSAVVFTDHAKRTRVQTDDVKRALDLIGRSPYHRNCTQVQRRRTVTYCPKKAPTRCHQGQTGTGQCMNFPKESFRRLIREVGRDFKTDLQYSSEALDMIQTDMEYHLLGILNLARLMAIHGGRQLVRPADIQLAHVARN